MSGTITALKAQKRNKDRVSVYLDGRFAFGVKDIVAVKLRIGQFLTDDDIVELQGQDVFERAYDRALNFLSYRPRSEAEVRRYLQDKQIPETVINATVERLARIDLLDDEAFLQQCQLLFQERERMLFNTLANTREAFGGVFTAGMCANAVFGSYRMGPVFGGMLLSGEKAASMVAERLAAEK